MQQHILWSIKYSICYAAGIFQLSQVKITVRVITQWKVFSSARDFKKQTNKNLSCFQPCIFDKLLVQRECRFSLSKTTENKQVPCGRLLRNIIYLILIHLDYLNEISLKYKPPQSDPRDFSSQEGIVLLSSLPPYLSSFSIIYPSIYPSFAKPVLLNMTFFLVSWGKK